MSVAAAPPRIPPPTPPVEPAGTPPPGESPDPSPWRIVKRLVLGCAIVLFTSAVTSAVFVSGEVQNLRGALSQNPSLKVTPGSLAAAGWGGPQTLLLVGDDQRALTGDFKYYSHAVLPHSNEMLLVRFDPSKPWISMMSIPRELKVTIFPPHAPPVSTRFNYAYTAGGIPLLLSTIKRVLGVSVNHVAVITFGRFRRAVDQMGCVYSTVDRRYYHVNVPGGEQYQEIDLQPGYQKLCGDGALQFVSYRHNDTSLVRDARDQSFLLDVKKQYGPTLIDNVHKFEQIFGKAVQTDPSLHSTTGILDLLGTLISSSARRVRQVKFQATLGPSFDTATPQQIGASVHSFLFGGAALPRQNTLAVAHAVRRPGIAARLPLVPTSAGQRAQARGVAANLPFPLEYPRVQDRTGAGEHVDLRNYLIHAPDGTAYQTYVAVFSAGDVGQYYDVQGTTWTGAPQFDSPEQAIHVGPRTYYLYYEGPNLKMVAWSEHGAWYWVRNSLTNSAGSGELLAIAEQTAPLGTPGPGGPGARVNLRAAFVPGKPAAKKTTGLTETLGGIGGLLTLLAVPLLAIPLIKRRGEVRNIRAQIQANLFREAQLSAALPSGGIPQPPPGEAPAYRRVRTNLRPRRWPRGPLLLGAGVATVAIAALLAVLLSSGGGSSSAPAPSRAPAVAAVPSSPVAVLNAGPTHGAARDLAQRLRSKGVKVATVGNVAEPRSSGVWVLYAPGARSQAAALSRLLSGHSPTVAPIDQLAQAAAGKAKLAVVIV